MPFTAKQKIFIAEYIKDKNASRAARAAGFSDVSCRETARRLLTKPDIRQAVEEALAKQAKRCEITADKILNRIAEKAFDSPDCEDHNILKALELLGKHFKLFTDVQQQTITATLTTLTRQEYKKKKKDFDDEC